MKRIAMAVTAFALMTGVAAAEEPTYGGVKIGGYNKQTSTAGDVTQYAYGDYAANEASLASVHNGVTVEGYNEQTATAGDIYQDAEGNYAQNCLSMSTLGDGPGCTVHKRNN